MFIPKPVVMSSLVDNGIHSLTPFPGHVAWQELLPLDPRVQFDEIRDFLLLSG